MQLLEELVRRRSADSAWSHLGSAQISVEATCFAILALMDGRDPSTMPGIRQLLRLQNRDGSWPAFAGDWEGCWTTALGLITVAVAGGHWSSIARAADWLVRTSGREANWLWRWKFKLADTRAGIDPDKYGWPWAPGTNSWVIPTAFAVIALKQFAACNPSETTRRRIRTGIEMLGDRACVGGGWNAGNSVVYGVPLAPRVETTAIAMMALQDERRSQVTLDGLAWLERQAASLTAILSLAWSILSLFLFGVAVNGLKSKLAAQIGDASRIRDATTLAVAALALQCGEMIHPFALIR